MLLRGDGEPDPRRGCGTTSRLPRTAPEGTDPALRPAKAREPAAGRQRHRAMTAALGKTCSKQRASSRTWASSRPRPRPTVVPGTWRAEARALPGRGTSTARRRCSRRSRRGTARPLASTTSTERFAMLGGQPDAGPRGADARAGVATDDALRERGRALESGACPARRSRLSVDGRAAEASSLGSRGHHRASGGAVGRVRSA